MSDPQAILDELATTQERLTAALTEPARTWMPEASGRAVLLHGPRGVGKTYHLLRHAQDTGGRYLSVDFPALAGLPLSDWVVRLFERGVTCVYLDEIHQAPEWARHLKALYDSYPSARIWASGSDSLLVAAGVADLSRRYLSIAMPFVSFREYLVLTGKPDLGVHDPFAGDPRWMRAVIRAVNVLAEFERYLQHGFRPFFVEDPSTYGMRAIQVAQKTLEADIPAIVSPLAVNHVRLMRAVLGYLATTAVPVVQVNSLCREWNVGKEKLYTLLHAMEQTGLLRIIRKRSDNAAMSIGAKMYLCDPSLYRALGGQEGNAREAFVACAVQSAGRSIHAESDETRGDFLIDDTLHVEVGGRRKRRKAADLVIRDGIDVPSPGIVPLWSLGFLW